MARILERAEGRAGVGWPVPDQGPALRWPPPGLDLEARASRLHESSPVAARLWVGARTLASHLIFRTDLGLVTLIRPRIGDSSWRTTTVQSTVRWLKER